MPCGTCQIATIAEGDMSNSGFDMPFGICQIAEILLKEMGWKFILSTIDMPCGTCQISNMSNSDKGICRIAGLGKEAIKSAHQRLDTEERRHYKIAGQRRYALKR